MDISLGRVLSLRPGDGQKKIVGRGDFPNQEAVKGAGVTFFYLFFDGSNLPFEIRELWGLVTSSSIPFLPTILGVR